MAAKARRKRSGFQIGLRVYSAVLVFLFGLALVVLWVFLSRYQQDLDEAAALEAQRQQQAAYELSVSRAPQLALEDFLAAADAQTWFDAWCAEHDTEYENEAELYQLIGDRFADPSLAWFKAADHSPEQPRYVLKSGVETLASLTLSGGELDWTVSELHVFLEGTKSASLTVPEGYAVTCNGLPLESSGEAEMHLYDMEDYADKLISPVRYLSYSVEGLLTEPVLKAEAPEGRQIEPDDQGTLFYILPEGEASLYQNRAESFVYDLLRYYMLGNNGTWGNMWTALDHVMNDSQAFRLIRDSYDGVTWDTCYNNRSYSAQAGSVRILADNCMMVDVVYHAEGEAEGHVNIADGTYRVYFLDLGSGYGIFGLAYV